MKTSKTLIIFLLTILFISGVKDIYSQKLKIDIDPETGDTTYLTKFLDGGQGRTYYYFYILKVKDDYLLKLKVDRSKSSPYILAEDKPLEYCLATNDTLKFKPQNEADSKNVISGLGLLYMFDKESTITYYITLDDIRKIKEHGCKYFKVYYYTESGHTLYGSYRDDKGRYFEFKVKDKYLERCSEYINKRLTIFLEAINH